MSSLEPTSIHRSILTIDLPALKKNYSTLRTLAQPAECAAVIKANGYGLGITQVAKALHEEGCGTFFVATLNEAITLRDAGIEAVIYVLDGLPPDLSAYFSRYHLRPVLNSLEQVQEWTAYYGNQVAEGRPCALHIDTGMNRLGLSVEDILDQQNNALLEKLQLHLIMSHLACGDELHHKMNAIQLKQFQTIRTDFSDTHACFANSAGIFLGADYHFDMVRAGIALYGGKAQNITENPMLPVVKLESRILQIRHCAKGETVGYGASQTLQRPSRIATLAIGYADGYSRHLSTNATQQRAYVYIAGHKAPIVGRVSMDLLGVDLTDIPEAKVNIGDFAEVLGPHILVDDVAEWAGTIGYEVLTNLGKRHHKIYLK